MPETTQSDLVEQLEAMAEQDREYGYHARAEMLSDAAAGIKRYRESAERLQKIESQMDGGRFDEWPTETFAGQLRMQSRDSLDPEYSQFMAATATHLGLLSGQYDAQREVAERAKADAARLRAHCQAMRKALSDLEKANEELCAVRSARTYHSIVQDGAEELLLLLDNARKDARDALAAYRKEGGA